MEAEVDATVTCCREVRGDAESHEDKIKLLEDDYNIVVHYVKWVFFHGLVLVNCGFFNSNTTMKPARHERPLNGK